MNYEDFKFLPQDDPALSLAIPNLVKRLCAQVATHHVQAQLTAEEREALLLEFQDTAQKVLLGLDPVRSVYPFSHILLQPCCRPFRSLTRTSTHQPLFHARLRMHRSTPILHFA
jgi:hypothetical protein